MSAERIAMLEAQIEVMDAALGLYVAHTENLIERVRVLEGGNVSDEDKELASDIATGMHTGLRKGSDAPSSGPLWKAISDSNDSAWFDAAQFCVYGLKAMGYTITRSVTDKEET